MRSIIVTRKEIGVALAYNSMGMTLAHILIKHGGVKTIEDIDPDHIGLTFSIDNGKRQWYDKLKEVNDV